jgi:hypothetical protein
LASKSITAQTAPDSSNYQSRKLKIEEVNFVTGFYVQNGDNAAVTGGKGNEHLTDLATSLNLTLSKYDQKQRKHSFKFELGVDVYSSASSDKINPHTISSASKGDTRVYPSINYLLQDDENKYNFGGGLSYSQEFDYTSYGANIQFSKWNQDRNSELTAKASVFLDEWKVILPIELRANNKDHNDYRPRNSYSLGLVYSQVVNRNFQIALLTDLVYQAGLLSTRYQRVYFTDGTVKSENLPDNRTKIPLGVRANYFLGDNIVLRGFYRYYWDSWNVNAHTASLELSYKLTPFVSVAPSYRFYTQTAADHFSNYATHSPLEKMYSSDYDLSKFTSNMFGVNFRFANLNDKFFIGQLNTLDIRYSYYKRNTGLDAHSITFALNFK